MAACIEGWAVKRIVVTRKSWGIYLGNAMGMGFWTLMDCVGQDQAATFVSEAQAVEHVRSWEEENNPNDFSYHAVECAADRYATAEELLLAGLPKEYVEPMFAEAGTEGNT